MVEFLESIKQSFSVYCEAGVGLFETQPINTVSSIALLISAYFAWRLIQEKQSRSSLVRVLPALIFLTGIGSALWHGYPNILTALADSVFLFSFLVIALYFLLTKLVKSRAHILFAVSLFIVVQIPFQTGILPAVNGLIPYSIILFVGAALFYALVKKYGRLGRKFAVILGIFAGALFFRTIDLPICMSFGIGSHFLWHILVAIASYLTVRFLVRINNGDKSKVY